VVRLHDFTRMSKDKKSDCQCIHARGYGVVFWCEKMETKEIGAKKGQDGNSHPVRLTLSHRDWHRFTIRGRYKMRMDSPMGRKGSPHGPHHTDKTRKARVRKAVVDKL
jgi:hypothetical protein